MTNASDRKTIYFVSLGCPKNRVDSEVMAGVADGQGYDLVDDPEKASVIVVNTCGFIGGAKQESIDTIFEMASFKRPGACEKLVVTGCLSQRHPEELASEMPEVDHFLGSSDMLKLGDVLSGRGERMMVGNPAEWVLKASDPRALTTGRASAYLKIAEGCNRTCSFCVIPSLRGKQRSRTIDDVVREAELLVAQGVLEINLVSQDTIVLQSGGPLNKWVTEEIDPTADFRKHFRDGDPDGHVPDLVGIGLMTDGDQTKSESSADYGGFELDP